MGDHYSWWMMLPHEDFARIVDPGDQAFTLLAANCTSALDPGHPSQPTKPRRLPYLPAKPRIRAWRLTLVFFPGISIKQIMAVITEVEKEWSRKKNDKGNVDEGMGKWLRYLNRQVEPGFVRYNSWPMWVQAQLERDPCFFGKASRPGKPMERSCVGYAKLTM